MVSLTSGLKTEGILKWKGLKLQGPLYNRQQNFVFNGFSLFFFYGKECFGPLAVGTHHGHIRFTDKTTSQNSNTYG